MNVPDSTRAGGIAGDINLLKSRLGDSRKPSSFDAKNTSIGLSSVSSPQSSTTLGTSVAGAPVSRGIGDLNPANIQSAARRAAGIQERPAAGLLPGIAAPALARVGSAAAQPTDNEWSKTCIGAGIQGGEIVGRVNPQGIAEFSNLATDQQAASGRQFSALGLRPQRGNVPTAQAPGLGLPGGARALASGSSVPSGGEEFARLGSSANVGNGIGGFSQNTAGDAALASARFERANAERSRTIGLDGGLRVAGLGSKLTADDILQAKLGLRLRDASRADLDLQQRGINAGLDRNLREREVANAETNSALDRQIKEQAVASGIPALEQRAKRLELQGKVDANMLLSKLQDPNLPAAERTAYERQYLLTTNPGAYAKAQATAGQHAKLTEQQSKDLVYFSRGNEANAQLAKQGDALTGRTSGERGAVRGVMDSIVRGTPMLGDSALGNSLVSAERQQAEQSGRELLASILRKDSGAAITDNEMQIYGRMYLPQPGDSDAVLNQKAEARTRALESIRGGLGTAQQLAAPVANGARQGGEKSAVAAPVRVTSPADVERLPSGSLFIGPDGIQRRKP